MRNDRIDIQIHRQVIACSNVAKRFYNRILCETTSVVRNSSLLSLIPACAYSPRTNKMERNLSSETAILGDFNIFCYFFVTGISL